METALPAMVQKVLYPERLVSRADIISDPTLVPVCRGLYGWYFEQCTEIIPDNFCDGCHQYQGRTLLYFGIAPKSETSDATLKSRIIDQHFDGDAEGSTLRFSLGCLLATRLGIELRLHGSSKRFASSGTLGGEQRLSQWISENAFVSFATVDKPWEIEDEVIGKPHVISLPLNIKGNSKHPFCKILKCARKDAVSRARTLPKI
jgi:hypothetical protein